jgi:hypothetical protein
MRRLRLHTEWLVLLSITRHIGTFSQKLLRLSRSYNGPISLCARISCLSDDNITGKISLMFGWEVEDPEDMRFVIL